MPWALYPAMGGGIGYMFSLPAFWPLLLAGALAVGLARYGTALPRVPPGDVVVVAERTAGVARTTGEAFERIDALLRQWPVAGVSLLTLAVVLLASPCSRSERSDRRTDRDDRTDPREHPVRCCRPAWAEPEPGTAHATRLRSPWLPA